MIYTRSELAEVLKVNPRTVDRMVEKGMPCLRSGEGGMTVRFDWDDVKSWMEKSKEVE